MKGRCPECEKRTTFVRVEHLNKERGIKRGAQLLNYLLNKNTPPPEVLCENCGVGLRIADID